MKQHRFVHAVVLVTSLSFYLGSGSQAWGQDKGTPRPYYPSGFAPGTRVTLLEDHPSVGPDITMGMSGTIVCCDAIDGSGSILVSWDLYTGGRDEEGRCVSPLIGLYPPGSTMWVNPAEVKLGLAFDKVGYLRQDIEGCSYLTARDGTVYYVVGGMDLGGGRLVPRMTYTAHIRGLLNRSPIDPASGRSCQQRDGDIYHPIVAMADWDNTPCADRWVCGFGYGDRVVLISESNPYGARNLLRCATGTIICSKHRVGEQSILVSWDLWTYGGSDDTYLDCSERVSGLFPRGSTWWVSTKDIAKVFETPCGILEQIGLCVGEDCLDPSALGLFAGGSYVYYLAGLNLIPPVDGRVKATGLFTRYGQLLNGQVVIADTVIRQDLTGMMLNPIVVMCPEPSCCEPPYAFRDRVGLLVDEPGGAIGLLGGVAAGTVVCCNPLDPITPIYVMWDNWSNGNNDDEACDRAARQEVWSRNAGWWVACSEIEPLHLADLFDAPGDFEGFLPGTLVAGKEGQRLKVSGTVGNRGGKKTAPFHVGIYASTDEEITRGDYRLGTVGMQLDVGARVPLVTTVTFPTSIPAGTYYIGWLIDVDGEIEEENETNNTGLIATPLTVTAP